MRRLLEGMLPQPGQHYDFGYMRQLVNRLQQILGVNVQTKTDADEIEAINWFLDS